MSEPRQTEEERMAEHKPKTYASGGYIPEWGESKPVGYYPGKDDPTPTPIDPADIRPGDVVRVTQEFEVESRGPSGTLHGCGGEEFRPIAASQLTWHLIHRPDPDAEAVQVIHSASYNIWFGEERLDPLPGLRESADLLNRLREQGWDVVRRDEEKP